MLDFNYIRLLFIVISTIVAYFIVAKGMRSKQKILLLFCIIFLCLYSGIGGALKDVNPDYTFFYIGFILIFAATVRFSSFSVNYSKDSATLGSFIDRHAGKLIILYFLIKLTLLIYPECKLFNLISPPPPMLSGFDFESEGDNYSGGALASIIYLVRGFVKPFFFLGLYKYRNKTSKILFFLFFDLYIGYCSSGYVGRGTILQNAIIAFFTMYANMGKKERKILVISACSVMPLVIFGFYRYSLVRMGTDVSGESISQAVEIVFGQEITYPRHFNTYINFKGNHIVDYLLWFVLLPLPGFLKFGYGNYFLNREFSTEMLGLDAGNTSFFVLLPGVVGESIYVFGPYLYWIHAVILGIFVKFVVKTFTSNEVFTYLYFLYIVTFSFMLARAGTISVYPTTLKGCIILVIVFYFVNRSSKIKRRHG